MAEELQPADFEKVWKLYSHADQIRHNRIESFLIAQAFFIGAYATLAAANPRIALVVLSQWSVTILAIAVTLIFNSSSESIETRMAFLRAKYLTSDAIWKEYVESSKPRITAPGFIFGVFFVFWFAALAFLLIPNWNMGLPF